MQDFTVRVRIKSPVPIKSVYSPSHQDRIDVTRKGDHEAVVGIEEAGYLLDRDFQLFHSVSKKDFGLDLACYRPDPGKPGYFMMLISPSSRVNADERVPRDICFVFDISGSMGEDNKIEQARKALRYCIDKLHADDRFNLITFATDVALLAEGMLPATEKNRAKARTFVETLEAKGGTNIHEALKSAVDLPTEEGRPRVIVFMTDGMPTIGDRTADGILAAAIPTDESRKARIFAFGVGDNVNTHLLDKISGRSGGVTEYVRPQEAIDMKVSEFFDKASYPVLTDLKLDLPKEVEVKDVYPRKLGDLYRGGQITVFGRYHKPGHVAITLSGRLRKGTERFVYESTFAEKSPDNPFIEPIWAHRKIGYLLDEIRLHGENKELADEVKRLGMKYSIQTPYTSFLVLPEAEKKLARTFRLQAGRGMMGGRAPRAAGRPGGRAGAGLQARRSDRRGRGFSAEEADALAAGKASQRDMFFWQSDATPTTRPALARNAPARRSWKSISGRDAVAVAGALRRLKTELGDRAGRSGATVRTVAGRRFFQFGSVWVDERFGEKTATVEIKFASKAYFALAKRKDMRKILGLGQYVIAVLPSGKALVIGDTGKTELGEKEIRSLFTRELAPRPPTK